MKGRAEIKHGHATRNGYSATYRSWCAMRARCTNPNTINYGRYGAAGVKVCERWESFAAFLSDMGERPSGCTLDRIDSSGDYEPSNCRWATSSQQARNSKRAVKSDGRSIAELCEETGIKYHTLYMRMKRPDPIHPTKRNRSGFRGVTAKRGKWRATIVIDGKQKTLGVFETPEAAHEAYEVARQAARQKKLRVGTP